MKAFSVILNFISDFSVLFQVYKKNRQIESTDVLLFYIFFFFNLNFIDF